MSLKILMDVGVGTLCEEWLSQQGHDVLAVRNIDPQMGDDEILEIAAREERLAVTMDKDFGELVYRHMPAFFCCAWTMQPASKKFKSSLKYSLNTGISCLAVSVFTKMDGCEFTHNKTVVSPQYLFHANQGD